jgi:hypothetical protein
LNNFVMKLLVIQGLFHFVSFHPLVLSGVDTSRYHYCYWFCLHYTRSYQIRMQHSGGGKE